MVVSFRRFAEWSSVYVADAGKSSHNFWIFTRIWDKHPKHAPYRPNRSQDSSRTATGWQPFHRIACRTGGHVPATPAGGGSKRWRKAGSSAAGSPWSIRRRSDADCLSSSSSAPPVTIRTGWSASEAPSSGCRRLSASTAPAASSTTCCAPVLPTSRPMTRLYQRLIARVPLSDVSASFVMEDIKDTTAVPIESGAC